MWKFYVLFVFLISVNCLRKLDFRHNKATLKGSEFLHSDLSSFDSVKVGKYSIYSIGTVRKDVESIMRSDLEGNSIFLHDINSGWGNGKHPTTRLCLDFIYEAVRPGFNVLDYGCGSGILTILAAKLGAQKVLGVDIDCDTLEAAHDNCKYNKVDHVTELIHTREVYLGDNRFDPADVTVANILPGPLIRLVAPLYFLTKPGGTLCLSGMRPTELPAIRRAYEPYVEMNSENIDTASHTTFGDWVRWTVTTKVLTEVERLSLQRRLTEDAMMDG